MNTEKLSILAQGLIGACARLEEAKSLRANIDTGLKEYYATFAIAGEKEADIKAADDMVLKFQDTVSRQCRLIGLAGGDLA